MTGTGQGSAQEPVAVRLGWPRVLRRWAVPGLVAGAAVGVPAAMAGFPGWAELTWQLLQCAAVACGATALIFWGIPYAGHYGAERLVPVEHRDPMPEWAFFMARPMAAATVVVVAAALAVTVAAWVSTGEWYSFAGYT